MCVCRDRRVGDLTTRVAFEHDARFPVDDAGVGQAERKDRLDCAIDSAGNVVGVGDGRLAAWRRIGPAPLTATRFSDRGEAFSSGERLQPTMGARAMDPPEVMPVSPPS